MIEWYRQVVLQVSKGNVRQIKPESCWGIFFGGPNFLFFGLTAGPWRDLLVIKMLTSERN